MYRIKPLPEWCLTDTLPAFYDTESATTVEETAKLYGKVKNLVEDYNKYVNEINKTIEDFTNGVNQDQEEFKNSIIKIMHDYIHSVDTKIDIQDSRISEAVEFMTINLSQSITSLLTEMKENGELDVAVLNAIDNIGNRVSTLENTEYSLVYESGTENLILQKTVKGGA